MRIFDPPHTATTVATSSIDDGFGTGMHLRIEYGRVMRRVAGRCADYFLPENMNRVSAIVASLAVVASVTYLVFAKLTPFYMANDDVALRTIIEGTYQDVPDAYRHLVLFTNVLFAQLLVALYERFPGIVWYDMVYLALNFFALAAIGYSLFRTASGRYSVLAVFTLLTAWSLSFFVSPQFTMTAALQCVAAVVLVVGSPAGQPPSATRLAAAFAFACAGYLVRDNAALLVLVAGSLFAVPLMIGIPARRFLPVVALGATFFAFVWATDRYDRKVYESTPGFENVRALNVLRAEWQELSLNPAFNSESNRDAIARALETTPLDAARMNLLRHWIFADARVNVENLRVTMDVIRPYLSKMANPRLTFNEFERSVFYVVEESLGSVFLVLLGCLLWPCRRVLLTAVWSLVAFGVLFVLVFVMYKMPPFRVYYPLLFLAGLMVVFAGSRDGEDVVSEARRGRGGLALFLVAIICATQIGILRERSFHFWPYYRPARHDLQVLDERYRYVTFGAVIPVTRLLFPYKPNTVLNGLDVVRNGWTSLFPYMQEILFTESLDGTVVDFVCAPATRVMTRHERADVLESIERYAAASLERHIEFELISESEAYDIFECRGGMASAPTRVAPNPE